MKNIVILCPDSLRFDYVTPDVMPNLTRISKKGVYFTHTRSGGTCTIDSMPFMLSGTKTYNPIHSIPSRLQKYGYTPTLLSTNPLVYQKFSRGFTHTEYHPKPSLDIATDNIVTAKQVLGSFMDQHFPPPLKYFIQDIFRKLVRRPLPYIPADILLQITLKHLDNDNNNFIWVHLMDSHLPYYPLKHGYNTRSLDQFNHKLLKAVWWTQKLTPDETQHTKQLYADNVNEMDSAIGSFYESLPENTILAIISDHGDEHGEHGGFGHHPNRWIPQLYHVPITIIGHGKHGENRNEMHHYLFPEIIEQIVKRSK